VIAKGFEKILQSYPRPAWTSILKRTPIDASKNPALPRQAAENGSNWISRQAIASNAQRAIQGVEVTLDDLLSKSDKTINPAKVAGYLNDLRMSYAHIPGEESAVKTIDSVASQLLDRFKQGKPFSLVEANQLKRVSTPLFQKAMEKSFEIPAKTEAQKIMASRAEARN